MIDPNSEVQRAAALACTEILNAIDVKGPERDSAGLQIERALKAFAKAILRQAESELSARVA